MKLYEKYNKCRINGKWSIKKVGAIDELNNTIADLEAKIENSNTDE